MFELYSVSQYLKQGKFLALQIKYCKEINAKCNLHNGRKIKNHRSSSESLSNLSHLHPNCKGKCISYPKKTKNKKSGINHCTAPCASHSCSEVKISPCHYSSRIKSSQLYSHDKRSPLLRAAHSAVPAPSHVTAQGPRMS